MSRREKLLIRMRNAPHDVRFHEVEALLRYEGFKRINQQGSHCVYHRPDGKLITIVRPHGGRKTCHPDDVRKLLKVLER